MSAVSLLPYRRTLWAAARRRYPAVLVAALVLPAACGDDSNGNDRSEPVVLRGGERLAWDQAADSIGELSSLTFRLYVDGTEAPLSAARCDAAARPSGIAGLC